MSANQVTTVNPATNQELASYPSLTEDGIDAVLTRAVEVQAQWKRTGLPQRAQALRALGAILRAEVEDHAALISNEMGKPITEARGEVLKCAVTCDYYADHVEEFLAPKNSST